MTTSARRVLADCREMLKQLQADPKGDEWRRSWILTVALLRSVGYVLKNADASSDPKLGAIVDRKWRELGASNPEPKIFWSFIDEERNNILKEYQINAGINVTVRPGASRYDLVTGQTLEIAPSRPTLYDYVINGGAFRGQDQREVVADAIEWWERYLSDIEYEYNKS